MLLFQPRPTTHCSGRAVDHRSLVRLTVLIFVMTSFASEARYATFFAKIRDKPSRRCPDTRSERGLTGFFTCSARTRRGGGSSDKCGERTVGDTCCRTKHAASYSIFASVCLTHRL